MMKKIGVMGAARQFTEQAKESAFQLGQSIAKNNCMLVTGATTGLSFEAAKGAKDERGFVLGISPAYDLGEHEDKYKMPGDNFDVIIFTGLGLKGRNLINIRSSDAVLFVGGSIGTLNEFTIAFDEGKVIGVLEGSGGVTDKIKDLAKICQNKNDAKIFFDADPKKLVGKVMGELK
jgi:uncharacterized protein (TIGR00725 family)